MSKRFTDTDKWKHEWFMELTPIQKCLWLLLCDLCDGCGIWLINLRLASFHLGATVTEADLDALGWGKRIIRVGDDRLWIPGFIKFQYSNLSERNKAHIGIMRSLVNTVGNLPLAGETKELIEKFRLLTNRPSNDPYETVNSPSTEGQSTLQVKDKCILSSEGGVGETKSAPTFDFEALYREYPKRKGTQRKEAAIKVCEKRIKTQEQYDALLAAVRKYAAECRSEKKVGTCYVAQFATFVNGLWVEYVPVEKTAHNPNADVSGLFGMDELDRIEAKFNGVQL